MTGERSSKPTPKRSRRPPPGVFTRNDRDGFWILYRDERGNRVREQTSARTMSEAADLLAAKKVQVEKNKALGIMPSETKDDIFAEVAQRFLIHQKSRLTPAAYERERGIVQDHLETFFKGKLSEITKADVQDYESKRLDEVAPGTVVKELRVLKHLFRLAVDDWDLLDTNPAAKVKGPKTPGGRVRFLQPDELRAVAEASPAWLRPFVALAFYTAMRRGEILSLRWSEIDVSRRMLRLPMTKNGDCRIVHLNQGALAAISSVSRSNDDRVFPGIEGPKVSVAFKRVCHRLKIRDFHFHDLRHCAASWLTMSGVDSRVVGEILGHRDPRMTRRYQQLAPAFVAEAVGRLDDVFGEPPNQVANHQEATKPMMLTAAGA